MMKIEALDQLDLAVVVGRAVLAGRRTGETDLKQLRRHLRDTPENAVVVFDLQAVEVLSSSYFLGGLWPLWHPGEGLPRALYPVLANASEPVMDEISFVLEHCGGLVWHFRRGRRAPSPSLLGQPDPHEKDLFDLVLKRGSLAARELHENDPSIGITAWSTRLAQQHQNRLLRRRKNGKQMIYSLPWVAGNG